MKTRDSSLDFFMAFYRVYHYLPSPVGEGYDVTGSNAVTQLGEAAPLCASTKKSFSRKAEIRRDWETNSKVFWDFCGFVMFLHSPRCLIKNELK